MTTNKTPRKAAATGKGGRKAPGGTSRRNRATTGAAAPESRRPSTPTTEPGHTRAVDLKPGDTIYPPIHGATGVTVESVSEPYPLGGIDRVKLRLYGPVTGIRTTRQVAADALVRTKAVDNG